MTDLAIVSCGHREIDGAFTPGVTFDATGRADLAALAELVVGSTGKARQEWHLTPDEINPERAQLAVEFLEPIAAGFAFTFDLDDRQQRATYETALAAGKLGVKLVFGDWTSPTFVLGIPGRLDELAPLVEPWDDPNPGAVQKG